MANLSNINGKFVVEQTTGYVGVGTTDPEYLLHINSSDIPNGTRLTIENTNGSGKKYGLISDNTGVFTVRDLTASSDRFSISNLGNANFTGIVTTDKIFVAKGQNLTHTASSVKISQENTTKSQIRCYGADVNTAGTFELILSSTDGTPSYTALAFDNTANATFVGNVFSRRGSFGTASNFNFDLYCNGNAYINDELTVDDNATFAGTGTFTDAVIVNGSYPGLTLNSTSHTKFAITNRYSTNYVTFDMTPQGGSTLEALTLKNNGFLGINRNSPNGLLHQQSAAGSNSEYYIQTGDTTTNSTIYFGDSDSSIHGGIDYDHNDDSMSFKVNNSNRMRITSAGQVNIYPVNDTSEAFRVFRGTGAYASQSISIDAKGGDANIRLLATDTARSTVFYRSSDGGGNFAESMRIDNNGSIGMGANNVNYRLRVKSDATVDNGIYLSAGTGSGNHGLYVENRDGTQEQFAVRGDGEIRLNATSGHTYAAQGIRFGANASANELDDYEEGTWTPTIKDLNGNLATLSAASGTYTKIGRQVILNYRVVLSSKGSMAGNYVLMGGIPFNHPQGTNGTGTVDYFYNLDVAYSSLSWDTTSTGSVCWLVGVGANGSGSTYYVTPSTFGGNETLKGSVIYTVS